MRSLVLWLLLTVSAGPQAVIGGGVQGLPQAPPRDARPSMTTGTGVIKGRVTAADTGVPLRRASVTLMGTGRPRMTYTDPEGRYEFTRLPAGTYGLNAAGGTHRAGYMNAGYGQRGPFMPPHRFSLADGQVLENANIALPRAGVITGRVTDAFGEPAARVQIGALLVQRGSEPSQRGGTSTDDLGQFRLFGLLPGEYIVKADSRMNMGGPAEVEGEALGFATTYAPGTPSHADAMRVRVTPGAEVSADIRLTETHVFSVSGQVVSSRGDAPSNVNVSLGYASGSGFSSFGVAMGAGGTFTFRNVPPGTYEITARAMAPAEMGAMPRGLMQMQEMGSARIEVVAGPVENVVVSMRPGETVTGEIAFDDVPPASYRANVSFPLPERRMFMQPPAVEVKGNTFTARGLFGPVLVRGNVSGSVQGGRWTLKAVLLDGKDITDVPVALGAAHSGRLQVLFTSTAPSLEGTVTDDSGKATRDATVVIFGSDEDTWTPFSSRRRVIGLSKDDGTFAASGLREGRYYVVAVPPGFRINPQSADRELFDALKKIATEVVLNPGETRTVDLRVVKFEQ